jgi:pimeloyl-ACP methyl ester carboxylesterase
MDTSPPPAPEVTDREYRQIVAFLYREAQLLDARRFDEWLALWGRDGKFCPVDGGLDIIRACDSARLVVFAQCGHWVQTKKAAEFNRLCVDFLQH